MSSARKFPQSAYAGVKIEKGKAEISLLTGTKIVSFKFSKRPRLTQELKKIANKKKVKIIGAALSGEGDLKRIGSQLWLKEDIVPFVISNGLEKNTKLLARFASDQFVEDVAKIKLGPDNRVQTTNLVTLSDYEKITQREDFKLLLKLTDKINKKKIAFFSATPRGGGVALMRHSLMRLFKLLGIDASWHVMQESNDVFEITKKKFHNVLHGIAAPNIRLNEKDKKVYLDWIAENAKSLHSLFHQAKVIVIDDPQPSGLVPYIKKASPKTKIIYRSHIQLETALFDNPKNPQSITWNFIWENIKDSDCFVSHPVSSFVPDSLDKSKVVLMTASLDSLDGLNKPLTKAQTEYYFGVFNRYLRLHGQTPLDPKRPYIVQVARFDPSKGIPDVVESYRKLRLMLKGQNVVAPQLVITGQGSIDDPEGLPILNETFALINSPKFSEFEKDIKIARTPAIDQIQNALMRKSSIYLQLSHKEGFEEKISAALMMGVPVITYRVGGMPFQVRDAKSGFVVERGDTNQVADRMFRLLVDKALHKKMSQSAIKYAIPEATTVSNAINWLYLANELVDRGRIKGNMQKVYDMARRNGKIISGAINVQNPPA